MFLLLTSLEAGRVETQTGPTHAGRAVLAAAGAFALEEAAVWEYVALGLRQHAPTGAATIEVRVRTATRAITICIGGPGMSEAELCGALSMPGGRSQWWDAQPSDYEPSRWVTAAFGIADRLEIESVRDGLCQQVLLTRSALAHAPGAALPLALLARDQPTSRPPGITITLDEIAIPDLDARRIATYLERRLASHRGAAARVSVDGQPCVGDPPALAFTRTCRPSPEQAAVLGDVALHLALARAPLPAAQQGILVLGAAGSLLGIERGGDEAAHCFQHLYGEITVPALDQPSAIAGRGPDRTLQLNPSHPVAAALASFLRAKVAEVGGQLAAQDLTAAWYSRLMHA